MSTQQALWVVSAASTLYLRSAAFIFVRMLPLGYQFMPKISAAFALSLASSLFPYRLSASSPRSTGRLQLGVLTPILLGMYSRRNPTSSFLGLLLNALAFLACLDFVYRAHVFHSAESLAFSRMGYVDTNSAQIVLRHPAVVSSSSNHKNELLQLTYYADSVAAPTTITVLPPTSASDYVTSYRLSDLHPGTRYTYNSTAGHTGAFTTSDLHPKRFSVISTSCQKPGYPYAPFSHALEIQGLRHLAHWVEREDTPTPEFVLFLGDFIYSDLPIQVADLNIQFYHQLYRQVYASPSWTGSLRDLPWIHMWDDHELVNDYYPNMPDGAAMYTAAVSAFAHYQGAGNPAGDGDSTKKKMYMHFRRGDASFFILDTRTYRAAPPSPDKDSGNGIGRTMLGAEQLEELLAWIDSEEGWKVVVSGVPMTRNWSKGKDAMDSWAGYLEEREVIFRALWRRGGGVVISGDRHEHATVKFAPPPDSPYPRAHTIIEFCTSPHSFFYQPFVRDYAPVPHEETVYHHPYGASKFGMLTFDSADEGRWRVEFELVVDGMGVWGYDHVWERVG